jgi:hypothetical protein
MYISLIISVVLFCPQNQSSLFRIPHSLAMCRLNFEVGSKDGHIIIGFSFVSRMRPPPPHAMLKLFLMCYLLVSSSLGGLVSFFVTVAVDRVRLCHPHYENYGDIT